MPDSKFRLLASTPLKPARTSLGLEGALEIAAEMAEGFGLLPGRQNGGQLLLHVCPLESPLLRAS